MSAEEVIPHLSPAPPQSKAAQLVRLVLLAETPHSRAEERESVLADMLEVQEVLVDTLEVLEASTWKVSLAAFSAEKAALT
jgi:hypothetical protein